MRHIIPISGKDSATLAVLLQQAYPRREVEYFFNATHTDLPETLEWLNRVSDHLGQPIVRVGADLKTIIEETGMLPSFKARFCTRLAKIHPMETYIGTDDATVYFGLRADEDRAGYSNAAQPNITPAYPLREWGIRFADVFAILGEIDLLPPAFHWAWMEDRVRELLGRDSRVLDDLPVWVRRDLLAWRSRTNCYHCFFQRYYEWVGLKEHHPDLFAVALNMEETIGGDAFVWSANQKSLRQVLDEAEQIKEKRARDIVRDIMKNRQGTLFEVTDGIQVTGACGLFCSK